MFISENPLLFVRHEHRTGTSQKTGNAYEITNITLSDGIESFKLPFRPELIHPITQLKRGDKVNVILQVEEQFNGSRSLVSYIEKAS